VSQAYVSKVLNNIFKKVESIQQAVALFREIGMFDDLSVKMTPQLRARIKERVRMKIEKALRPEFPLERRFKLITITTSRKYSEEIQRFLKIFSKERIITEEPVTKINIFNFDLDVKQVRSLEYQK